MNGTNKSEEITEDYKKRRRPIVTCSGELEVFATLESSLVKDLSNESCEWRRLLGRPIRSVYVSCQFTPFSVYALPRGNQWDLIRQPLFHVYWTDCCDVDVYKSSVKKDIEEWLHELTSRDIDDWLIVVIENYDGKRPNKLLPRTTVLDKIRADFAPKQGDRCISVINPGKIESRSANSWDGLVSRIRHYLVVAYGRAIGKFEDHVRQQRERRNEVGWNFMQYFKLQEELGQILEMLGLHDEALVQYDELDAVFSQFVVNGHAGDAVSWLANFQRPLERWHALRLRPTIELPERPSLLELRAYLFAKQAHMLQLADKIWEMASRCLPFLHTCTKEIYLLDIASPPGALCCWQFLAAMEVLQACEKHNEADKVEAFSLHTAPLWAYASQKLRNLGKLCGLMPGVAPTSEQLHVVVGLSAGMGDNAGPHGAPSPTDKLKEALCSQDVFNKIYLELAELAVGTYKHIGRLRSAKLIGREVASFYTMLGEIQKSAAFHADALRTFEQDGWRELAAHAQIDLAECHKRSADWRKYVRACAAVCTSPEIDNLIRWSYFDEMQKGIDRLEKPLLVQFNDIVRVASVNVKNATKPIVVQDAEIEVEVTLESNFPREILCNEIVLALEQETKEVRKVKARTYANICHVSGKELLKRPDVALRRLKIQRHYDYQEDKQLAGASVVVAAKETLSRADSIAHQLWSNFDYCLTSNNKSPLPMTPGINVIRLSRKATDVGKFYFGQIAVRIANMDLLSISLVDKLMIEVKKEEPTIRLDKGDAPLLSGLEQIMRLTVTIGSYRIESNSLLKLTASSGLRIRRCGDDDASLTNNLEIVLDNVEPFASTCIPIRVLADVLSKDDRITIVAPWTEKPVAVALSFAQPLTIAWRLYTVECKKFVHVTVTGQCENTELMMDSPLLTVTNEPTFEVREMNVPSSQIITNGLTVCYIWELLMASTVDSVPLKLDFEVKYSSAEDAATRSYHYYFTIKDYQTLYVVDARVEPARGNEFCRVGALCHLHLSIKPCAGQTTTTTVTMPDDDGNAVPSSGSLMYEVVAEQSVWAVCGRTAGVVSFDADPEAQTVTLDVMPLNGGHLPLPVVRLSKYTPAEYYVGSSDKVPRLQPFSPGQIYNASRGRQVYVIAAATNEPYPTGLA